MNEIFNPLKLLRELKGCPLSVLFALAIVKQPVSPGWLERITGYSNPVITKGIKLLCEFNYILKISGQRYQIAENFQLPLIKSQKMFEISTDVNDVNIIEEERFKGENININNKNFKENLKLLNDLGIYGKKAEKLAGLEWINKDYIERMAIKFKNERTGLLIYCMENHQPAPEVIRDSVGTILCLKDSWKSRR